MLEAWVTSRRGMPNQAWQRLAIGPHALAIPFLARAMGDARRAIAVHDLDVNLSLFPRGVPGTPNRLQCFRGARACSNHCHNNAYSVAPMSGNGPGARGKSPCTRALEAFTSRTQCLEGVSSLPDAVIMRVMLCGEIFSGLFFPSSSQLRCFQLPSSYPRSTRAHAHSKGLN